MIKYSSYTNHLQFSLRCHHNKILPKDLQLKSRIKTERSKIILQRAGKLLQQERIHMNHVIGFNFWPDDGRSISRNVAHLNILVHDVINLLYYGLSSLTFDIIYYLTLFNLRILSISLTKFYCGLFLYIPNLKQPYLVFPYQCFRAFTY